jgi:phenylpropionate dioxygenase-like ring-hydroxylating dioxygenase large terminal subunit
MDRSLQEPLFKEIAGYMSRDSDRTRLSDRELYHPTSAYTSHDGGIKAFVDSCRHRGAKACSAESGSAQAFTRPYHGWTYGRDGALLRVPRDGFPNLDPAKSGLAELPCEARHGLIWVVPTPGAEIDVARHLGPVDNELAQYPLGDYVLERQQLIEEDLN